MAQARFLRKARLSQRFCRRFGPLHPGDVFAKVGVVAPPVVRGLDDANRLEPVVTIFPGHYGLIPDAEFRHRPVGVSPNAGHRLIEIPEAGS